MRSFMTVYKFEVKTYLRKKSFVITTMVLVLLAFILTSLPTLIGFFTGGKGIDFSKKEVLGYYSIDADLGDSFSTAMDPLEVKKYGSEEELLNDVRSGAISKGFIIQSEAEIESVVIDQGMYDASDGKALTAMKKYNRDIRLKAEGIEPGLVDEASNAEIIQSSRVLGKAAKASFAMVYIAMITVYMLVLMYGSIVATSVAREKSDRTMELLITSTNATSLITGKVFAAATIGLVQVAVLYFLSFVGIRLNSASYPPGLLESLGLKLSAQGAVVLILFAGLGYLMYLFLFAGLGALVSKVEDVSTSVSPVTFIFVAVYMLTNLTINLPDSPISVVVSMVPFSSPMAMFARYSLVSIPLYQMIFALVLLVSTTVLLAMVSIKIYRLGTLNYGNRLSLIKAIKMSFSRENS